MAPNLGKDMNMRGGFVPIASSLFRFMYSKKVPPQELSRETQVFWGSRPSSSLDALRQFSVLPLLFSYLVRKLTAHVRKEQEYSVIVNG